jgi:thiol:disulfide interchange protein DsbD
MLLAGIVAAAPTLAQTESAPIVTDRTRATLMVDVKRVTRGGAVPVALRLQLRPGWHTYWRNPGDSGEPAGVKVRVAGQEVQGPDSWPVPERIDVAGIVSYGHHGDVLLVTTIPGHATREAATTLDIEATATWLVCEKVCVPEAGKFALSLPLAGEGTRGGDGGGSPQYPQALPALGGLFARTDREWTLRVPRPDDQPAADAYFFPADGDLIDHSAPQVVRVSDNGEIVLTMTPASVPRATPPELRGVLAVTHQRADGAPQTRYFDLSASPSVESR